MTFHDSETHLLLAASASLRKWWALKRLLMEFVSWTEHAEPTDKWLLNLPNGEMILWGSCFMKDSAKHSAEYRRKWLANYQYRQSCLWNFMLHEKICWILSVCRLKMDATMIEKNFGNWPDSEMSLSFLEFWKLLTMYFLFS